MTFKRPLGARRHPKTTTVTTLIEYQPIPVLGLQRNAHTKHQEFLFSLVFILHVCVYFGTLKTQTGMASATDGALLVQFGSDSVSNQSLTLASDSVSNTTKVPIIGIVQ